MSGIATDARQSSKGCEGPTTDSGSPPANDRSAPQKFARPDDGFAPATDHKFNFYGHLNRIYGKNLAPAHAGLKDGAGFIID
jgi:hypothetical protein